MKKKIIFVLVYNEWDGGGGDITENVIASSSMDTIVAYKMDLEEKSAILQNQILELEQQRDEKVKPIWEKLHPIIQDLRQSNAIKMDPKYRSDLVAERDKLNEASGALHQEFYKKKQDLLNNMGVEYYIDDPELASFIIEELEVI